MFRKCTSYFCHLHNCETTSGHTCVTWEYCVLQHQLLVTERDKWMARHSLMSFPNDYQPSEFFPPDKAFVSQTRTILLPLKLLKEPNNNGFECKHIKQETCECTLSCSLTVNRTTENQKLSHFFMKLIHIQCHRSEANACFHHFKQWRAKPFAGFLF